MPETKLKELHMGKCFADLEKHHTVPKLKDKKAMILCNTAEKLNLKAVEEFRNGDEEQSYISYMKFLAVVEQLKTTADYTVQKANIFTKVNKEMVNDALDAAENLKKSLLQRYEVENQLKKLNAFEQQNVVRHKIDTDRQKAKESQYISIPSLGVLTGEDEVSIKCTSLYSLLKGDKKILILDARCRADYAESHIKYPQCINIPEECIEAGITANKLEKNLPSESKHLWSQRKDMDLIVIMDWSSNDFVPGKTVHLLRTIFIKWDTAVIYKRSPILLEGGFEDWLLRYPSYTTNPHITPPNHNTKLDDLLNDINYPILHDSMSPVEKKQMFDRNIKPDLHNADRISFHPYNSGGNPNVDRSSKAAALETYEKNNQVMKQLLEEQERLTVVSLSIEKDRIEEEENWQKISSTSEKEPGEGEQSDLQLIEHEILSKIMLLENNQRDTISEINRLTNQLEELRSEVETDESASNIPGSLSPNANSLVNFESIILKEDNVEMDTMEQEKTEAQARLAEEALEREQKIKLFELERATLNKKREAMEVEREKKLKEARAKKKVLYNNKQLEYGNNERIPLKHDGSSILNRSHSSPNIAQLMDEDESMLQATIPQFDRTMKPSHKIIDTNPPRLRDFQGVSGREGRGLTGLKNLGNTCYMNSIMQCLSNTAVLTSYFCEGRYRQDVRGAQMYVGKGSGGTRGAVAEEVAAVVQALWSEQYRFISAKDLRNVVGRHQAMFRGIEQQDSHEFLTILMDWLHNDLQTPTRQQFHMDLLTPSEKAWLEYTKSKESLILKLFYGQMKSTVKCLECGKESITHDSFSNLSLELPAHANKCNLSDCLELYLKDERIIGWNCPSCKQKRDAVKKLDISRLPPILVIHFKRFYVDAKDYISNTYRKKLTNIDFPLQNLDMGQFSLQSYKERKNTIYNLYGVSNHYGSMEGGHYTAYCKSSVYSKWYKFDDHVVTEISDGNVKSSAAYILFYTSLSEGTLHH